jgi:hypothetical protein
MTKFSYSVFLFYFLADRLIDEKFPIKNEREERVVCFDYLFNQEYCFAKAFKHKQEEGKAKKY